MIWAIVWGAVTGLGVYLLVRVWLRPRPGVATLIARIDSGSRSMQTRTVTQLEQQQDGPGGARGAMAVLGDRLEVVAADRGWRLGRVRADLAIMNRTIGSFLALKTVLALVFFLLAPVLWSVLRVAGIPLSPAIPALAALVLGGFAFIVPDLALRGEAVQRRRDFRRVVGIFLDLVAMNLAGGRGLPEALLSASTISDQWTLVRIRQALANARLFGTTPWAALGELGKDVAVEELSDLSAALMLAADDGAKIRQSLSARAATLRRRELADSEGDAGEQSQSMLVAQLVLCMAFMVFLAYPAISALTS